jgi:uncharacterized protein (DUF488 family)
MEVLTIGHSTLSTVQFLALLRHASVTAVADVRSTPYSRHFQHFNRERLQSDLRGEGVAYVFLGDELGGRPKNKTFFQGGVADYEQMARSAWFAGGLDRVIEGARKYRIALMCSEQNPLDCHRCLLVGRALHARGVTVRHVLAGGVIVNHNDIEIKLMALCGKDKDDLFEGSESRLAAAYRTRAFKVAFSEPCLDDEELLLSE